TEVQRRRDGVWSWFADSTGTVRGGLGFDGESWSVYRRNVQTGDVRKTATVRLDPRRENTLESVQVLPAAENGIVISNARTGRFGVYKFDFSAQQLGEAIFEHPTADVKRAELAADGASVEAVYYE